MAGKKGMKGKGLIPHSPDEAAILSAVTMIEG